MRDDCFQEEKLHYEEIEIPKELLLMVRRTIAADRRKKAALWRSRLLKMAGTVAAILFLCLTIGVNTSYGFAETVVKIPVVKSVAKAVVIRGYRAKLIAVYEEQRQKGQAEEAPENQPEETATTENSNDVLMQEEASAPSADEKPEEAADRLAVWKAEMTPEKFREVTERYVPDMEETYADKPELLRTILLAGLPEKEISLYGYHESGSTMGVALFVKDSYRYFDWNYMNEDKKLPEISFVDTDGDGSEEVVVFLYNKAAEIKEIVKQESANPETPAKETAAETTTENSIETGQEKPSVSGNDISGNEPVGAEKQLQPEEVWIISLKEESWNASVFSAADYESLILQQPKTEEEGGALTPVSAPPLPVSTP